MRTTFYAPRKHGHAGSGTIDEAFRRSEKNDMKHRFVADMKTGGM